MNQHLATRAAFDIGSGKIKLQVAEVNLETNQIERVLFSDGTMVTLRQELLHSDDSTFSAATENKVLDVMSGLLQKAARYHPQAAVAVATESFRVAKNGACLAKKIATTFNLPTSIICQEQEGILGFLSAASLSEKDPRAIACLDIGGGSFQVSAQMADRYHIYHGNLGKATTKHLILTMQGKELKRQRASPNPMSENEVDAALQHIQSKVRAIPDAMLNILQDRRTTVIGIGAHPQVLLTKDVIYSQEDVRNAISSRLNLGDDCILTVDPSPNTHKISPVHVLSDLVLAYGLMSSWGIDRIHYIATPAGITTGLLLSPKYWQK